MAPPMCDDVAGDSSKRQCDSQHYMFLAELKKELHANSTLSDIVQLRADENRDEGFSFSSAVWTSRVVFL